MSSTRARDRGACKRWHCFHLDNSPLRAIFTLKINCGAISISPSAVASSSASEARDVFDLPFHVRARRAARALGKLVRDPYDTQQVFELSTNINVGSIRRGLDRFFSSGDGKRLFEQDRSIDTAHVNLDELAALPDGTLGREYVRFLRERGFSPDLFQAPENVSDQRAAYVMKRIRQTHDLWHLLTGHETNPAGEVALQAFTFGQLGAPSSLLIALAGTVRGMSRRPSLPRETLDAYRAGRRAAPMAAFVWEDHWATPLDELRERLGISPVAPLKGAVN